MARSYAARCGSLVATLCLLLLLLLQTRTGNTAPAQHLAISVEGNTPTLIVTSAEIGITPKILAAGSTATTATTTTPTTATSVITPTEHDGDRNAATKDPKTKSPTAKLKGNKSNKLLYAKKRLQYAAKEKEALTRAESGRTTTTATAPLTEDEADRQPTTTTTTTVAAIHFKSRESAALEKPAARSKSAINEMKKQATKSTKTPHTTKPTTTTTTTTTTTIHTPTTTNTTAAGASTYSKSNVSIELNTNNPCEATTTTNGIVMNATPVGNDADKPAITTTTNTMADIAGSQPPPEMKQPTNAKQPDAAMATTFGTVPHEVAATTPAPADARQSEILTQTGVAAAVGDATITTPAPAPDEVSALPTATAIAELPKQMKMATVAATMGKIPTATQMEAVTMATATITTSTATATATIAATARKTAAATTTTTTTTSKMAPATSAATASVLAAATSNAPVITADAEAEPKEIATITTTTTGADPAKLGAQLTTSAHGADKVVSQQTTMVMSATATATTTTSTTAAPTTTTSMGVPTTTTTTTAAPTASASAAASDEVNATSQRTPGATTVSNKSHNEQPTSADVDGKADADAGANVDGGQRAATSHATPTSITTTTTITTTATQSQTQTATNRGTAATTTTTPATIASADFGGIVFIDAAQADEPQRTAAATAVDAADGIVKLIDLEGHDSKSIEGVERHRQPHNDNDNGHDGVKRTRKKQLIDKHFLLLDANANDDSTATIVDSTTGPTTTTATTTTATTTTTAATNEMEASRGDNAKFLADNVATATATTTTTMPSLMPVHNGYLGPIFMEEKTFSVIHAHRKPQPHHETSIESQLRDGRIVEIIAPTALLEPSTTTTTTTTITTAASSHPPAGTTPYNATPTTSNTLPLSPVERVPHPPVLSTTVFQVPETLSSTTRLPAGAQQRRDDFVLHELPQKHQRQQQQEPPSNKFTTSPKLARTESKISDIQIEVYDSTIDSIVASTNFKDADANANFAAPPPLGSAVGTTRPPAHTQERFTQYVVDRASDYSTQESSVAPLTVVAGKPEPAAIEIHINVSEGVGNESEDLEFSYRQSDYFGSAAQPRSEYAAKGAATSLSLKPFVSGAIARNDTNVAASSERSDEILVVEIIDTGDNSTENSLSAENINPIFTFRSDSEADVELKDIKYYPPETLIKSTQLSDELFLADLKRADEKLSQPPPPPPPPPRKPSIDRDSDTIFYISNTEVKVGESLPTANTNTNSNANSNVNFELQQQQLRKTRLENQFFPANYMASTHPNAARPDEAAPPQQHRYEEDIILSPLRNTADALKIFRSSQGDGAPPLDVTYVGESVMEVEQSSGGIIAATTSAPRLTAVASPMPDVIIQPAILPEMSIGVPVIGELPPQIELKEIDFMPDEANQLRSGVYENNIDDNGNGNGNANGGADIDRLVESSVQYGGDLIDESVGGGGFDGIEGSYPFGNPVARHAADYATHYTVNRGGFSHLRKDELSVDVASSGELVVALAAGNIEQNGTLKELLANRSGNETTVAALPMSLNASYAERMSNATAYSVMEERTSAADGNFGFMNLYTLIIGLFIVLLPVVLTVSMACALRYLYIKYQPTAGGGGNNNVDDDSNAANQANGTAASADKAEGGATQHGCAQATQRQHHPTKDSFVAHNPNNTAVDMNSTKPSNSNAQSAANTLHIVGEKSALTSSSLSSSLSFQAKQPTLTVAGASANAHTSSAQTESDQSNNSVHGNYARPNGSVTTMTLKNNHLIVETEERHDISRDARETKMHYNTSEKDGVFVVEVARGVDSKTIPDSPVADGSEQRLAVYDETPTSVAVAVAVAATLQTDDEKVLQQQHEEVQIHQPPAELPKFAGNGEELQRSLHQIVEVEEPSTFSPNTFARGETNLMHSSNTGLSQSDLSSSSSTDSNKRYSYGNQELYTVEQTGYATQSPTAHPPSATTTENGIGDDDDRKSENGHCLEHSPAQTAASHPASEQSCGRLASDRPNKPMQPSETQSNSPDVRAADKTAETAAPEATATAETDEIVSIDKVHAAKGTATVTATPSAEREPTPIMNGASSAAQSLTPTVNGDSVRPPAEQTPTPSSDECNAYDSIMSLPDPPSTEEITQLYGDSLTDINQLDSLPPPPLPPPPLAADVNDNTETAPTQTKLHTAATTPVSALTNGNNNANTLATTNGNGNGNGNVDECQPKAVPNGEDEVSRIAAKMPSALMVNVVSNGKMSPAPLTPPASPPTSLSAHFSNGLNGVNGLPMPLAVDVNGS